ncbi:NADPH-dependent FMN reductase [Aliikangiella sp. IMCC44359]|uniref:NADPH-dependent FMN reductase n=1 Tax=Aliikangiella sp. IMCC44359 TaxID=3459125 RepID=UPI00403B1A3C
MRLLIVSGSHRKLSQSAKVGRYLAEIAVNFQQVNHIELCQYDLPFWDGEEDSKSISNNSWNKVNPLISQADALIVITPEWNGMATPLIKNFLLMCNRQDTAHKPVLLVSVVSGISGAYPIAELRMNAMKNNKLVTVPDHLIIRHVEQMLNVTCENEKLPERDYRLRERINYTLHMLFQYSGALKQIRLAHKAKPYPKQQEYHYGM